MNYYGNLQDNAEASADDGGLPRKFQREGWECPKESTDDTELFQLQICDSGQLGLKNWLWLRWDQYYWDIIWEVSSLSQYTEAEAVVWRGTGVYFVLTDKLCNVKDSPKWS